MCIRDSAKHPTVAQPVDFELSDEDYAEFKKRVLDSGFTYDRTSEKFLKDLEQLTRFEGYYDDAKPEFEALKKKLSHNVAKDLEYNKQAIKNIINNDLMAAYYFQRGATQNSLRHDKQMDEAMKLITDGERPVALAGVMGGMDSEIEDDTVDVMVESACFNAGRTSHTSRDLSLISDASIRFERQVDETGCVDVANITCALIEEIAGGEVAPGYVDVFPAPKTIDSIKLRLARVHAICGADIEPDFIERSLTRLGCTVERDGEDFMVTPPSFRPDLPREIDLIEEVLRLWGMGRVTATIPAAKNHIGGLTREQKLTRKVGEILRACGLNETTTFGFAAPGDLEKIGMSTEGRGCPVVLMNPLVAEQTEMRRSLLPGLLQSVAYNEAHGTPNVHLYEVGSLFHGRENASLPKETKSVAGVLSGQWSEQSWTMKYRKLRFFFGKGIVEELLAQLRIEKVRFRPVEGEGYAFLQPGRAAEVLSGGTVLGWVGEIHPEAREAMGIDEVVVAFELDLDKLIKGARNQENYREFSQYPAVEHDLAIVVDNAVTCEDLERRITSAGGKLLEGVRLFDVYRDPVRVGVGKKSMAFALTYRSDDHTLTSEEVEKAHQKIVTKVCKGVNGEVRGYVLHWVWASGGCRRALRDCHARYKALLSLHI